MQTLSKPYFSKFELRVLIDHESASAHCTDNSQHHILANYQLENDGLNKLLQARELKLHIKQEYPINQSSWPQDDEDGLGLTEAPMPAQAGLSLFLKTRAAA